MAGQTRTLENQWFKPFLEQPWLKELANLDRWTISTNDKMPIDMFTLKYKKKISGADSTVPGSLISLHELYDLIPNASNFAFNLDASLHRIVVLDIEPCCPEHLKQELWCMPCLYAETSMSGKGIHMVFDYPEDIITKYPNAFNKPALKDPDKNYEILMFHYVTFTGRQLPCNIGTNQSEFRSIFEKLASIQKESIPVEIDYEMDDIKPANEKLTEKIMLYLETYASTTLEWYVEHNKTNEGHLKSDTELGYIAKLNTKLNVILKISEIDDLIQKNGELTDTERIWFLTTIAKKYLPWREKHEEYRSGVPWLMYLASRSLLSKEEKS